MSESSDYGFRVTSDCSPVITDKIIKGLNDKLLEGLSALETVTLKAENPFKLTMSFVWVSIFARDFDPNSVRRVNYRVTSVLSVRDGDGWKSIPGYEDNFSSYISENVDQKAPEAFNDVFNGVIYVLGKAFEIMAPR